MCSFQAWWHYYHKRWVYQLIIPLRQAGMELSVLLAGQPQCCVSDLWLNQPKNTAQFWLLLSSPCTTSRFFSLFPHSALTASRGGQEAGRAQSLDRGLGHPDYKIQATNLTLSDAPVPCTRQTQTRGKCSCQTRALHLCHTFRPTGLGGQTELHIPTHSQVLLPAWKRENFPRGAVSGWLPAKEQWQSYHSSDKRHEKKDSSFKSFRAVLNTGNSLTFQKGLKEKKGD